MEVILDNIRALMPFAAISWGLLIIYVLWKPQRFRNSFLLIIAVFFTMFLIAGLFGDYMEYALLVMFLIVMLMIFMVPVMLIFNGIQMMKKESRSLGNMLSLFLGVFVGVGEIAAVFSAFGVVDIGVFAHYNRAAMFIGMTVFYFCCILLAFVIYTLFIQWVPHRMNYNYLIIHGCGLLRGREISRLLANRLDKAIAIYNKCRLKPILIPSGGKGSDESISEAEAMKEYLLSHGIPAEHIIIENRSTTTMENLINSKEIIDAREGKKKTALITSNYHVYRCLLYANKLKMKCTGIGAKVAWYYWPSALIREFVAVFTRKRYLLYILCGYIVMVRIPLRIIPM